MATRWSSHRPAWSMVSVSACLFVGTILSKSLRAPRSRGPHHSHFSHGWQNRRSSFLAVVARFGKRWEFGDNREVCKAFVCQYAPPRSCCSWGPADQGSQTLHARTQTATGWPVWWWCDRRWVRTPQMPPFVDRTDFFHLLFAKDVAIDLKCIENHGCKPWETPQLTASCKWSSFRDCQGIFRIVARKDSLPALDFQTLRPIIYFSAASAEPSACVCEVFGTISDSVRLRTCLVYCRTFGRTPKSASTDGGGGARPSAGYQRVRRNGLQTDSPY